MNLLKALATVSSFTLLSRITGLVREMLIARALGASAMTDAFNVAFRIPNLLRRLFAEGAFSQAFVPILGEIRQKQGEEATRALINAVATLMVWILTILSLTGVLIAPLIVWLIASGFKNYPETFQTTVFMTRIMFPYIGFISLVALASGVLNTYRHFALPAFTPVLLNLSFIASALFLAPYFSQPVYAMAYGVLLGGIAQFLLQIPALYKMGLLPRLHKNPRTALAHPGVQRVLKQMLPATLGVSVAQISLIINTNIGSHLSAGSVSWLSYADRLMEFPTALLGVALGTILLPSLTKAHADNNLEKYGELLDWGLRLTCLLALPSAVALMIFGIPLTASLFHYGQFDEKDVFMTNLALVSYSVGLLGLILIKILAPGFYARQDIRTPVRIAIAVLITTQVCNYIFVPHLGHAGLALSISCGALINATTLAIFLVNRGVYKPQKGWGIFMLQIFSGLLVLSGILKEANDSIDWIELGETPLIRVGYLFSVLIIAGIAYFGTLWLSGIRKKFIRKSD